MTYVRREQLDRVKQVDLLTYLQQCEPEELVQLSLNTYSTRTHDSLKISNGMWHQWSTGIGGRSALDYLIKIRGMSLPEAALAIERTVAKPSFSIYNQNVTVEYPVTLSVGNITIEKDDTRIGLCTGQAAALTDEDIAIINACPQVCGITMLGANTEDLNRLALLENITLLNISGSSETDFSALASIKKLERLEISCCLCIKDFLFLADCDNLEHLSIYDCEDVNDISIQGIASAQNLKELNLAHLYNVTDISALGSLKNLEILYLSQTGNATGFSFIPLLDNLQALYLSEVGINNIGFLSSMKQLKKLEVGYCRLLLDDSGYSVEKVEDLSPLASMAELDIYILLTWM